jgi:hypothetical protein
LPKTSFQGETPGSQGLWPAVAEFVARGSLRHDPGRTRCASPLFARIPGVKHFRRANRVLDPSSPGARQSCLPGLFHGHDVNDAAGETHHDFQPQLMHVEDGVVVIPQVELLGKAFMLERTGLLSGGTL